ncbi:MAG: hypothetical protein ABIZ49_12525 [Opitutaceae bacterium]
MSSPLQPDSLHPAEQLDEVMRREAWLRVKFAHDFMTFETQVKALRKKVDELSAELGARNAYVHELHLERQTRDALVHELNLEREKRVAREGEMLGEFAIYSEMLRAAEDEREALRAEVAFVRAKSARGWRPFGAKKKSAEKKPVAVATVFPAYDFLYYLYTSPFRLHRGDRMVLRGWVMPRDGRELTAVRVRVGDAGAQVLARVGLEEPEVVRQHGAQAKNPRPGFEAEFPIAPGRQWLRLEAQLEGREWFSILHTPIWVLRGASRP